MKARGLEKRIACSASVATSTVHGMSQRLEAGFPKADHTAVVVLSLVPGLTCPDLTMGTSPPTAGRGRRQKFSGPEQTSFIGPMLPSSISQRKHRPLLAARLKTGSIAACTFSVFFEHHLA